ncbi:MAG: ribose-phosphate pyrophosphokinase [Gammaproteobacteria bacterium]|nr:ribose-phosphate pyrophosphokinase [Gammaproteobacteria bacterium]
MSDLMLFSGNANPALANAIADNLGISLGNATVGTFSDGETQVEIFDNVRGRDVFIIQPTSPPTNDNLMELVTMIDALRRSSAARITAVIPYFGYARQDRRIRSCRVPITARVVADILATVGLDRVLTVDIHAEQIQGFFHIPLDNVYGSPVIFEYLSKQKLVNPVVVSPDVGGVVRARAMAKRLDCDLAIIDKRRPKANEAQIMHIIGDVEGRHCLIFDDIVDTAGTLCKAASALKERGAAKVSAYCIHPVLSGNAIDNINSSELEELVVTDSIPLRGAALECPKIKILSLAQMLSETIRRINNEESISVLFSDYK